MSGAEGGGDRSGEAPGAEEDASGQPFVGQSLITSYSGWPISGPASATEEQIIYEITKAVFSRLGTSVQRATVEDLVADVYRAVRPAISAASEAPASKADDRGSQDRIIISVFGLDRPGIVSAVSSVLADADCSIVDINQTVVGGKFAMVLVADSRRSTRAR